MSSLNNFELIHYKLENGLEVILNPYNKSPLVSINIWYKVGSANEVVGKTGLAHLFEHMMFQGSLNVPKEMHFKYIQEAGGSLNGSTSFDRTNYYETLPSNALELGLWLESDRMGFFLDTLTQDKLDNQKDVVMNERRQNYDNQPYGLAWEKLFGMLFPINHPYHFPTIGLIEDIEKFDLGEVSNFFKKYYSPANSSLVITGDFDIDETKQLIDKYFAPIQTQLVADVITKQAIVLSENKFEAYKDNVQLEKLYLGFHSAELFHKDDAACDILSYILSSNKSSRLYKRLFFEEQIVLDAHTYQFSGKYNGVFFISATAKPNISLGDIKAIIFEEIEKLINNGISDEEIERAKNSIISNYLYSLQNFSSIANYINMYNCYLNKPNSFEYDLNRYKNLTKEQIIDAAKKYLTKNYVELQIIPK